MLRALGVTRRPAHANDDHGPCTTEGYGGISDYYMNYSGCIPVGQKPQPFPFSNLSYWHVP